MDKLEASMSGKARVVRWQNQEKLTVKVAKAAQGSWRLW